MQGRAWPRNVPIILLLIVGVVTSLLAFNVTRRANDQAIRRQLESIAEAEQIRLLEARTVELEQALHEAQVRAEIALVLPRRGQPDAADECGTDAAAGKKTRRRRLKIGKSR